ncbi:MAG: hypothetical protein LAT64_05020 [Phycisphaerales bacterium]|nr:hypothetical protein [Planctomycetota bacterium]MCH8508117.1 hypothetical protein [Phycisphaerales bacterium]
MLKATISAAVLIASGSVASAQLRIIEVLPGYHRGWATHASADGSVLALELYNDHLVSHDGYVWSDGSWQGLPRYGITNLNYGLSSDGTASLNFGRIHSNRVLSHTRNGVHTSIFVPEGEWTSAALTRDGSSVFYHTPDTLDPIRQRIVRWDENGPGADFGFLPQAYASVTGVHASSRRDMVVLDVALPNSGDAMAERRTVVYENGAYTEIGTLPTDAPVRMNTMGVSADGSVIVGWQESGPLSNTELTSWMYRDGHLNAIEADGYTGLRVQSLSDDAGVMLVQALDAGDDFRSLLLYDDGRTVDLMDLFLATGYALSDTQEVGFTTLSGDGLTVVGSIVDWPSGGPVSQVIFTMAVPTPGVLAPLAGLGLLARRRR